MHYFGYENLSFLVKDLHTSSNIKKDQILEKTYDSMIDLRNYINKRNLMKVKDQIKTKISKKAYNNIISVTDIIFINS